ncbi:SDR family NAD(P)-dependent oxidoreductase [Acinetobacter sp. 1207_04]|uniref:SDR family NAD(P)-dependent oxidoreductase n=1 Tax=Acinetobacter sp. 1207_04 TaxID=2604449 RepID=UPI0040583C0D
MSDEVVVVIGSGAIAQAITRRIGTSKIILLADIKAENMITVVDTLSKVGFIVHTQIVDVGDRASIQNLVSKANQLGHIVNVIHTAGLSPSQASAEAILKVDLYGTAVVLEEFGHIISKNGSAIVIGSQSSHRLDIDAIS